MSDTALRLIEMLRLIPRSPRRITTTALRQLLADAGHITSARTIQRDLQTLSQAFPLVCDDRTPPYGWSWSHHARTDSLPSMDGPTALTFRLAEEHLKRMLPMGVLRAMEPHFAQARSVLAAASNGFPSWPNKIRVLPGAVRLLPPRIDDAVMATLYEGLMFDRRIAVTYEPRSGKRRDYELSPQGLAFRDSVIYLVASHRHYPNVVMYALHRFRAARLLDTPRHVLPEFDFDQWVDKGGYNADTNAYIRLVARFAPEVGAHLLETPLCPDQRIGIDADGSLRLIADVPQTLQLEWWLRGFGEHVEVLAPQALRQRIIAGLRQLAVRYDLNRSDD